MNAVSIIILSGVLLLAAAAIIYIRRHKSSPCNGNCAGCDGCKRTIK